jgi:hypothetical protein
MTTFTPFVLQKSRNALSISLPRTNTTAMAELRKAKSVSHHKLEDPTPNGGPIAIICVLNGAFLAACGYHGASLHGFDQSAMHSLYMGAAAGGVLGTMGLLAVTGSRRLYMIGVHVALLLELIYISMFSFRAYKSYGVPEKADRFNLFILMGTGCILSLGAMRYFKPKPKQIKGL